MIEENQNPSFSFADLEFQTSPAEKMAEMRDKCPVHHTSNPSAHYTLTRESDVVKALRDETTWSSQYGPGLAFSKPGTGVLVSSDPPVHTKERLAISRIFRPSIINQMQKDIQTLVHEIIDSIEKKGNGDLIDDFAAPIPLTVMCWMLGTPTEDISSFRSWVLPMAEAVAYAGGRQASDEVKDAYKNFYTYFGSHIEQRNHAINTGLGHPDDLLTRLLTVENNGEKLTVENVLSFCQFLLVAGSETTTLMIGNLLHRLMENPDQLKMLQDNRSLIPNAIEESLRYDAPVHGLFRTNTSSVILHDVEIPADSKVCMMFGSANRDPLAWDRPHDFDITRDLADLRNHTSFGVGAHYCLGAPLSRLEGSVALSAVLDRLPRIRSNGPPTLTKAGVLKGFSKLPVRWD